MVGTLCKRLTVCPLRTNQPTAQDADTTNACVDAMSDVARCVPTDSLSLFFRPIFVALNDSRRHVQEGAALCLSQVVLATHDGQLDADLGKLVPRILRLMRQPNCSSQPQLLAVLSNTVEVCGGAMISFVPQLITTFTAGLASSDWGTRKAAAQALLSFALNLGPPMLVYRDDVMDVLDDVRFDTVRTVREAVQEAAVAYRNLSSESLPGPRTSVSSLPSVQSIAEPGVRVDWSKRQPKSLVSRPGAGDRRVKYHQTPNAFLVKSVKVEENDQPLWAAASKKVIEDDEEGDVQEDVVVDVAEAEKIDVEDGIEDEKEESIKDEGDAVELKEEEPVEEDDDGDATTDEVNLKDEEKVDEMIDQVECKDDVEEKKEEEAKTDEVKDDVLEEKMDEMIDQVECKDDVEEKKKEEAKTDEVKDDLLEEKMDEMIDQVECKDDVEEKKEEEAKTDEVKDDVLEEKVDEMTDQVECKDDVEEKMEEEEEELKDNVLQEKHFEHLIEDAKVDIHKEVKDMIGQMDTQLNNHIDSVHAKIDLLQSNLQSTHELAQASSLDSTSAIKAATQVADDCTAATTASESALAATVHLEDELTQIKPSLARINTLAATVQAHDEQHSLAVQSSEQRMADALEQLRMTMIEGQKELSRRMDVMSNRITVIETGIRNVEGVVEKWTRYQSEQELKSALHPKQSPPLAVVRPTKEPKPDHWVKAVERLASGRIQSAYDTLFVSGCEESQVLRLMIRTGPCLEALGPSSRSAVLLVAAHALVRGERCDAVLPWIRQAVMLQLAVPGNVHEAVDEALEDLSGAPDRSGVEAVKLVRQWVQLPLFEA